MPPHLWGAASEAYLEPPWLIRSMLLIDNMLDTI